MEPQRGGHRWRIGRQLGADPVLGSGSGVSTTRSPKAADGQRRMALSSPLHAARVEGRHVVILPAVVPPLRGHRPPPHNARVPAAPSCRRRWATLGGERVTLAGERHRWTASGTDEMPRGERQRIFTSSLSSKAKCLVTLHRRLEIILSTIACERQICFCLVLLEIGLVTGSHMPEAEIRLFSPLSNETLHGVLGSVTQTRVCNPATTPDHHTAVGTRDKEQSSQA
jgi:hypothetical protein